jgi:hypothetical protein
VIGVTARCDWDHCEVLGGGLKSGPYEVSHQTNPYRHHQHSIQDGWKAIPRNRVYSEVAKQLQTRIVSRLQPGDMFPQNVNWFRSSASAAARFGMRFAAWKQWGC